MTSIALITGGQQGIGFGIARALAGAGYTVISVSQLTEDSAPVNKAKNELGSAFHHHHHDIRDTTKSTGLIDRIVSEYGVIDCFVSNAGVSVQSRGDMLDIRQEHFDLVMDVNLRGSFFFAQTIARHMQQSSSEHYRSISFITSVSAEMTSTNRAEYCMSKAAQSAMSRLFAIRMACLNIGVFEIRPGVIATDMTKGVQDEYDTRIKEGLIPLGRWGHPEDIGPVICAIAKGDLAYATGSTIQVDGGLSISTL